MEGSDNVHDIDVIVGERSAGSSGYFAALDVEPEEWGRDRD
jgi:hypothetical protein